jgi:hypothetical protein
MFSSSVGSYRTDGKFAEYAINCVCEDEIMKCKWTIWKRFSAFKELLVEINADLSKVFPPNNSFSLNSWNDKFIINKVSLTFIEKRR